jgi:sec-independent protein translocase protein TatA
MGRIGMPELIVILIIVLLIFGAAKLPELAKAIGKSIKGFKQEMNSSEKEEKKKEEGSS